MRVALGGRATALALFAEAAVAVSAQRIDSAVILGVDSYLRTSWLAELDQAYMLKSERNFDGFVPAEAAACVLLEPAARAAQRQSRVWATVKAVAHEPYAGADSDNTGEVLARVASACLPPAASSPLVVTDLNGTTSKAREWGFALSRLGDRLANPQVEYPVVSLGDVGAASGVVLALFAAMSLADEHTNLEHVLVCAASDAESAGGGDSLRASLLLGKPAAAPAVVQRPAEDGEARERTFAWLQVPSSTT
jgi:3-oxoacyl-(acyl-carrier-protein) synthase